jgi:phosphoribosylamine--glycine ligase
MEKKTFLFLNLGGDWLAIADRVKKEGYPIYFYKKKGSTSKDCDNVGVGYFDKDEFTDDFWEVLNKVPKEQLIILVDDNGHGDMVDFLRNDGYTVLGGSAFADEIEYDRTLGLELMKKIGLEVPNEKEYSNLKEAIRYLETEKDDSRYVFKPHGESFAGGSLTYTSKNKEDLQNYMEWLQNDIEEKHYKIDKFVLQEFVDGIEADLSSYFDGEKFMEGICLIDIEEKKIADGNVGEACGCMGNIIINFPESKYMAYLEKLTPYLKKANYVGEISINNIFAKGAEGYKDGQPYGLEFTSRFGWDAHNTEAAIIKADNKNISDFYIALAEKSTFDFPKSLCGCAVRVYTGCVSEERKEVRGRLLSYDDSVEENIWPYSLSIRDGTHIVEDNPVLLVQTANKTVPQAIKSCYKALDELNLVDKYYRNEIGKRAADVISFLDKYNWL